MGDFSTINLTFINYKNIANNMNSLIYRRLDCQYAFYLLKMDPEPAGQDFIVKKDDNNQFTVQRSSSTLLVANGME
jgi:hypothetical protein